MSSKNRIIVVSDATGETAEKLTFAVLTQFGLRGVEVQKFVKVDTEDKVAEIVRKACDKDALLMYSLARKSLRDAMRDEIARCPLASHDLLGPIIDEFSRYFHKQPEERPGAQHIVDDEYFRRVDAMEFTVKHDDGVNVDTIYDADIVIIGISRTSKTPLSIYLSHEGFKVANLPFVPGITYPVDLDRLGERVVGLIIDPMYLVDVRKERLRIIGTSRASSYADLENIYGELDESKKFYRMHGIPVVDVTRKSIEETASEILSVLGKDTTRRN